MKNIVSVQDVSKNYILGTFVVPALRGVSLDVEEGEFLAIAGPSGSGKTTLLNLIGCVDTPTAGKVAVAGNPTGSMSERQLTKLRLHTIGFIFQSFNLVSVLSVFQNIELPLLLQRSAGAKERRERVRSLLDRVGIAEYAKHRPSELSGGQRQRVAIARALVNHPSIILADEPTGNLDSATGEEIMAAFQDIWRQGNTVIVVTHEADIASHARRVVRMRDGHIESDMPSPPRSASASAAHA